MSRSYLKGPYIAYHLFNKVSLLNKINQKSIIKTWSRSSTILPIMIGHTISIHNGIKHIPIYITDQLIGYKLGEFAFTRKFISHKNIDNKIKNK